MEFLRRNRKIFVLMSFILLSWLSGWNQGVILVSLGCFYFYLLYELSVSQKEDKPKDPESTQSNNELEVENIGDLFFRYLGAVASQNVEWREHIRVDRIKKNGEHYSIFVGLEDQRSCTPVGPFYSGYPIVQVNFDRTSRDKFMSIFQGPYGPQSYYSFWEIQKGFVFVSDIVQNYSLYQKKNTN